ncbi:hypothetical protein EHS25_001094 [Saitozyma podzolica]|uniref:TauD/TfdA-like domain-containing protein n=1 Tax=Saitozyma podzolica TaxID=1890683 RepID=A0A427YH56_9TREE|nr:hypothetical protein EHS25_001094 [Saitozyma podzolica]
MAPIAVSETQTQAATAHPVLKLRGPAPPEATPEVGRNTLPGPLKYNGLLEEYPHFEVTPSIGREYGKELQLTDLLAAENADDLIQDLAVLISRRGVCFFREQECSQDNMMKLARRLGELTGRPKASNMCIHPVSEYTPELVNTPKTQVISADRQRKGGGINRRYEDVSRWANVAWHSDVSFEKVPSDYSMLKVNVLPPSGDSRPHVPSFLAYLETLTCQHNAQFFHAEAEKLGLKVRDDIERGNPLNKGDVLTASHPVVRTNPVTGWKALFVNRGFSHRIEGVTKDESDMIMKYINDIAMMNFDCHVRFRWEKGSIAIWDNRSTWHSATFDYEEERAGERASSLGEVPYFDPNSISKSEGLKQEGNKW